MHNPVRVAEKRPAFLRPLLFLLGISAHTKIVSNPKSTRRTLELLFALRMETVILLRSVHWMSIGCPLDVHWNGTIFSFNSRERGPENLKTQPDNKIGKQRWICGAIFVFEPSSAGPMNSGDGHVPGH